MNWSDFYLICFLVGFGLTVISFFSGTLHLPHLHLPHLHFDFNHGFHFTSHGPGGTDLTPWFNFSTLTVFLTWFGGVGYLLQQYAGILVLVVLLVASLAGVGGAAMVVWFLTKFLLGHQKVMDPSDYELIGMLGRLSAPIREGGTGEMIFSQDGARRVTGARAENGDAIDKGTEVVITRYEKGIAYVRRWDEMVGPVSAER
jgi:membrane protein implicated in regulation of membrane protease activity